MCLSSNETKFEWHTTMFDEFTGLLKNKTWDTVTPSTHHNVAGYKCVFRIKHNPDGSISCYKARLVAKVFNKGHLLIFMKCSVSRLKM